MMQQSNGCGSNSPSSFQNHHHQIHQQHLSPSPTQMPSVTTISRTWHPHVYAKPPRHPTPHFIADILGFRDRGSSPEITSNYCPMVPSPLAQEPMPLLNGTALSKPGLIHHSELKSPVDQPLNLSCTDSKKSSSNSPYVPTSVSNSPVSGEYDGQSVPNGTLGPQDTIVIPSVVCKLRLELAQKAGTPPNGASSVSGNICINRPIARTDETIVANPCHKDGTVTNVMANPISMADPTQPIVKGRIIL